MAEHVQNLAQLSQLLRLRDRVVPIGAGTKPSLSARTKGFDVRGIEGDERDS